MLDGGIWSDRGCDRQSAIFLSWCRCVRVGSGSVLDAGALANLVEDIAPCKSPNTIDTKDKEGAVALVMKRILFHRRGRILFLREMVVALAEELNDVPNRTVGIATEQGPRPLGRTACRLYQFVSIHQVFASDSPSSREYGPGRPLSLT